MTVSEQKAENWAPFHDAQYYEADALSGNVRSLPRTTNGRFYPGTDPLKPQPDPDGYLRINYRDDNGVRHEKASVARCMLMAHDPEGYFPGAEACHGPGGRQDNRLANLRWDTKDANREEALALRLVNSPPKVKPPKVCPRCGAEHRDRGQNCHACVVQLGVDAAPLLVADPDLKRAAETLEYPSTEGVFNLAVRYGGLRCYIDEECIPAAATGTRSPGRAPHPAISPVVIDDEVNATARAIRHAPQSGGKSRSVINRLKAWLANSDAR